jgi:hypothetical protein
MEITTQTPPFNLDSIMVDNNNINKEVIQDEKGPVIASQYQPETDNIVCELNPAQFDGLVKILNKLTSADFINIQNSSLIYNQQGIIVLFNLQSIHPNINLHISNAKNLTRILKTIDSNNNVFVVQDEENCRYVIDNGEIKLFLPMLAMELEQESFPDLSNHTVINEIELDSTQIKKLQNLCKDAEHIEYLFDDNNNCKGVYIYEQALYIFPQYLNEPDINKFNESTASLALRSNKFPTFEAEKYQLVFLKDPSNMYSLYVKIHSFVEISWYESLQNTTGGNVLI